MQGYFFSKPCAPDELSRALTGKIVALCSEDDAHR